VNIDDTRGGSRPVHSLLLGAEVLIVEHLCHLSQLPDEGFTYGGNLSLLSFSSREVWKRCTPRCFN